MESSKRILGLGKKKTADIAGGELSTESNPGDPARATDGHREDSQRAADAVTDAAMYVPILLCLAPPYYAS